MKTCVFGIEGQRKHEKLKVSEAGFMMSWIVLYFWCSVAVSTCQGSSMGSPFASKQQRYPQRRFDVDIFGMVNSCELLAHGGPASITSLLQASKTSEITHHFDRTCESLFKDIFLFTKFVTLQSKLYNAALRSAIRVAVPEMILILERVET